MHHIIVHTTLWLLLLSIPTIHGTQASDANLETKLNAIAAAIWTNNQMIFTEAIENFPEEAIDTIFTCNPIRILSGTRGETVIHPQLTLLHAATYLPRTHSRDFVEALLAKGANRNLLCRLEKKQCLMTPLMIALCEDNTGAIICLFCVCDLALNTAMAEKYLAHSARNSEKITRGLSRITALYETYHVKSAQKRFF